MSQPPSDIETRSSKRLRLASSPLPSLPDLPELPAPNGSQNQPGETRIVAIFNHKGGVGKTTCTAALGWKLASEGARVLLVDADPQCNLTGFLVDPGCEVAAEIEGIEEWLDPIERFYLDYPTKNIHAALAPLMEDNNVCERLGLQKGGQLVTDCCFQVKNRNLFLPKKEDGSCCPPLTNPPETLYLLAGHADFAEYEQPFTLATCNSNSFGGAKDYPGSFSKLFSTVHDEQGRGFDYIILDLSPSASIINRLLVMSSNFLILPCSADYFSFMAVRSMKRLLPQWQEWFIKIRRDTKGSSNPLPTSFPVFLGHVINLFTLSPKKTGMPASSFLRWVKDIEKEVVAEDGLLPKLRLLGMALPLDCYPLLHEFGIEKRSEIVSIRNFQSAGPAATKAHVPAFAMDSDLLTKASSKSSYANRSIVPEVGMVFSQFSQVFNRRWEGSALDVKERLITRQKHVRAIVTCGVQDHAKLTEEIIATLGPQILPFLRDDF